jgi:hypothetical protein
MWFLCVIYVALTCHATLKSIWIGLLYLATLKVFFCVCVCVCVDMAALVPFLSICGHDQLFAVGVYAHVGCVFT